MLRFSFEGGIMILTPVCTGANGSSQDTGSTSEGSAAPKAVHGNNEAQERQTP